MKARGRNGWFDVDHIETYDLDSQDTFFVQLWSKSPLAKSAPVVIDGTATELVAFCKKVLKKVGIPEELMDQIQVAQKLMN